MRMHVALHRNVWIPWTVRAWKNQDDGIDENPILWQIDVEISCKKIALYIEVPQKSFFRLKREKEMKRKLKFYIVKV